MGKSKRRNRRLQALLDGRITVQDLDNEEITRGQLRDKNGDFRGRKWDLIPAKLYKAMAQENIIRQEKRWQELYAPAINTLNEIRGNPRLPADARMKSAIYIVERAAGKVPEKQEMYISVAKWEEDIEDLFTYDGVDDGKGKRKGKGTAKE